MVKRKRRSRFRLSGLPNTGVNTLSGSKTLPGKSRTVQYKLSFQSDGSPRSDNDCAAEIPNMHQKHLRSSADNNGPVPTISENQSLLEITHCNTSLVEDPDDPSSRLNIHMPSRAADCRGYHSEFAVDHLLDDQDAEIDPNSPADTNVTELNTSDTLLNGDVHLSNPKDPRTLPETEIDAYRDDDAPMDNEGKTIVCSTKISNWRVLWALLSTNGALKLTKLQYQAMKNFVEAVSREGYLSWRTCGVRKENSSERRERVGCLPHFSTLQKKYRPLLFRLLVARSTFVTSPVDMSKAVANSNRNSTSAFSDVSIQIIRPSEYARSDMATGPVWAQITSNALSSETPCTSVPSISASDCVDIWPLVAAREWFYGPQRSLRIEKTSHDSVGPSFAEAGDEICVFPIDTELKFSERVQRCFAATSRSEGTTFLEGRIVHCWTVHHFKRRDDDSFQDEPSSTVSYRDRALAKIFNFVSYTSPFDAVSVTVPQLPEDVVEDRRANENQHMASAISGGPKRKLSPLMQEAIKARRAALKERKSQMEAAWARWTKPLIKPGDFITLLEPKGDGTVLEGATTQGTTSTLLSRTDRASRLCVVSRFWTENEERSRHVFFIPGGTDVDLPPLDCHLENVLQKEYCSSLCSQSPSQFSMDIRKIMLKSRHSGPRGYSSYAPVSSVGTLSTGEPYFIYRIALFWDGFEVQRGKSASGEGFYLLCLNLPPMVRSSPQGVRVISLTPPGVNGDIVLDAIIEDIVYGMKSGFIDYDADGVRRRIFLDLVGFLGDTPAINAFLDVLGHNASACCHLCRFYRGSETLIGSRYALGESHGSSTHAQRGFYQHTAVRDCGAQSETCRLLGLKHSTSSASQVLHRIRNAMFCCREHIPKTSTGLPVVFHHLDPYRACFVAPDHLLTGHLKDCISLVLKLLPSASYSEVCEKFILCFLRDAGLPVQNRLFDHGKKTLFSMSMTELYALSIVSETGFLVGCSHEDRRTGHHPRSALSSKCREAVSLLGSCSRMIAAIWYKPNADVDGQLRSSTFDRDGGEPELQKLQGIVFHHLERTARICRMSDSSVLALEEGRVPRQKLSELSKLHRETLLALRAVDKPNLHRLRELVFTTVPMLGHVSRFGELVLEKTHQILKRAIVQSNNKDIHLHSMRSAAFSDWAERLTMVSRDALKGSAPALRSCFRFLAGREALHALLGNLASEHQAQVIDALGPGGCLADELQTQGRAVLSTVALKKLQDRTWAVRGEKTSMENLSQSHPKLFLCLKASYNYDWSTVIIHVGNSAVRLSSEIRRGDIVQMLCYHPTDYTFHYPRVVQLSAVPRIKAWENNVAPAMWCVAFFCTLTAGQGPSTVLAALLPCTAISAERQHRYNKYRVCTDRPLSIAKMDASTTVCPALHSCLEFDCKPLSLPPYISHGESGSPINGGHFFALTRETGFPPRKG